MEKKKEVDKTEKAGAEKVMPFASEEAKGKQVEKMFDSIAPRYDFMNTAMTFGLHRRWRNRAMMDAVRTPGVMRAMRRMEGVRILDVATGTGDLALWFAKRLHRGHIIGVDISEGMLSLAKKKRARLEPHKQCLVDFRVGDCLNLEFEDDSFDLITVAYGVRNFERLADGLAELRRVLRPGGTLCVLELSCPRQKMLRKFYDIYANHMIPGVGALVSGSSRAYKYLPESIAACPQREEMTALMRKAGLSHCRYHSMTFGAVTSYIATKD